jgi:hypothetical protein
MSARTTSATPNGLAPPLAIRLSTMKATPATPSTSPKTFREVIRSPRNHAASSEVSTGLVLTMSAVRPADTVRIPE